jgi:CubicO group peptidase (beta-lactamase class C family)/beta-lactamase regulating signal transducer with metallopeptidase domain
VNDLAPTLLSAIFASLWLGACLVFAATLLLRALPELAPRWRYRLWLGVLIASAVGLVALPLARSSGRAVTVAASPTDEDPADQSTGRTTTASALPGGSAATRAVRLAEGTLPVAGLQSQASEAALAGEAGFEMPPRIIAALVILVFAGAFMALGSVGLQLLAVGRLKRRARRAPSRLGSLWSDALERLPTRRALQLMVSGEVPLPVACGYLRPAVLVPEGLSHALTDQETRHLLLHELAHLVRRDDWGLLSERVIGALCWWNPVVWWVSGRLDQAREQACDALAAAQSDNREYARTLVRLAELVTVRSGGLANGALRGQLTRRVEALLARPKVAGRTAGRLGHRGAAIGLAGVAFVGGLRIAPPEIRSASLRSDPPAAVWMRVSSASGVAAGPEGLALDSLFTAYADSGFSGTILLARRGEILLNKGYGLADRERGIPATASTRYSTAGITKLFTAAALLQLASEGKLSVSDPVSRWIGPLPGSKDSVTLDELLTYRDGLTRLNAPVQRSDPEDFVRALGSTPASFTPGSGFRYNDHGHSLLGLVIERASGESYEAYVRRRFLDPAGLASTGFENDGGERAKEYTGPASALVPVGPRAYRWGRRASLGLVSTAGDLYRWFQVLSDAKVVSPTVRNQLFQVRGRTDYNTDQGYGLELVDRGPGHRIWRRVAGTPGFEGEVLYDPSSGWTAVILVNTRLGWRFRIWRDIERAMWP